VARPEKKTLMHQGLVGPQSIKWEIKAAAVNRSRKWQR